jgi:hypothetical protein
LPGPVTDTAGSEVQVRHRPRAPVTQGKTTGPDRPRTPDTKKPRTGGAPEATKRTGRRRHRLWDDRPCGRTT